MQKQVISFAQVINFCKISSARGVFNPETPLAYALAHVPSFACWGGLRKSRADCSTVGLYCATITWLQICKDSLYNVVAGVLLHETVEQGCQFGFFEARFWNSGFFWTLLAFFANQKKPDKIWLFLAFFRSARLGSGKALSELRIHSLLKRVYNHAGCIKYWKDFTVSLKMIDAVDKKQMCHNVITVKENGFKEWNFIIAMVLTSFNVYFVFGYAYFMCICCKTAIWIFLGQSLAFFGEDRLATLLLKDILAGNAARNDILTAVAGRPRTFILCEKQHE